MALPNLPQQTFRGRERSNVEKGVRYSSFLLRSRTVVLGLKQHADTSYDKVA